MINNHNFKKNDIVKSIENNIMTYRVTKANRDSVNIQVITDGCPSLIYEGVDYEILRKKLDNNQ